MLIVILFPHLHAPNRQWGARIRGGTNIDYITGNCSRGVPTRPDSFWAICQQQVSKKMVYKMYTKYVQNMDKTAKNSKNNEQKITNGDIY